MNETIHLTSCPECGIAQQVVSRGERVPLRLQVEDESKLWEAARIVHDGLYARKDRGNYDYISIIVETIYMETWSMTREEAQERIRLYCPPGICAEQTSTNTPTRDN